MFKSKSENDFTLIELLIVISIIMLLAGIMLPALSKAKALSLRHYCLGNEKQIGIAISNYSHDNNDWYLPAMVAAPWDSNGYQGWDFLLFPYIYGEGSQYSPSCKKYYFNSVFACPDDKLPRDKVRSYSGNASTMKIKSSSEMMPVMKLSSFKSPSTLVTLSEFRYSGSNYNRLLYHAYTQVGGALNYPSVADRCYHKGKFNNALFVDGHTLVLNPYVAVNEPIWVQTD